MDYDTAYEKATKLEKETGAEVSLIRNEGGGYYIRPNQITYYYECSMCGKDVAKYRSDLKKNIKCKKCKEVCARIMDIYAWEENVKEKN
jgi:DNA-directed RNA polymerase subunit RPC12/RpoP